MTTTTLCKALLFISPVILEPNCKKYILLRKQYRTHPLFDNKNSMPQQNTVYTSKTIKRCCRPLINCAETIKKTKTSKRPQSNSLSVAVYNEPRY